MIRYCIAIVDDEETIRDSLQMILCQDFDISCFGDAESFLLSLETSSPDLVLMDIGLPVMSGIEALEIAKKKIPDLPIIMITAFEEIQMVIRS
ncbi:MAG: response regulator transcription factor, partial [Desulfobacula sp.]